MTLQPSNFIKALGLPLVCAALFVVMGGHWAVFQGVAWAQMLWTYSQEAGSVIVGAEKTFSGEFPCEMCKSVTAAKQKEEKAPALLKVDKKAEVFLVGGRDLLPAPPCLDFAYFSRAPAAPLSRRDAPPAPVPILTA